MKASGFLLAGIALFLLAAGPSHAQMYKWVDKDGVIHFQDTPPVGVPPSTPVRRIPVGVEPPPPAAPEPAAGKAAPAARGADNVAPAPASTRPAARKPVRLRQNPKVEIYGTSWCPYCRMARDFFRSRGISFDDYDVERDYDAARRKKEIDPAGSGVPTTVIDGQVIHGFSEEAYLKALEAP